MPDIESVIPGLTDGLPGVMTFCDKQMQRHQVGQLDEGIELGEQLAAMADPVELPVACADRGHAPVTVDAVPDRRVLVHTVEGKGGPCWPRSLNRAQIDPAGVGRAQREQCAGPAGRCSTGGCAAPGRTLRRRVCDHTRPVPPMYHDIVICAGSNGAI